MLLKSHERYFESLKDRSISDPIYHPDSEGLKPGHCGYFDDNGRWKHMFDIMAINAGHSNYKPLASLVAIATTGPQRWGPVFGSTVKYCAIEQTGEIAVAGAPVTAGVNLKFEKSSEYGAVLMADPVTYESFPHKELFH
ncbi:hypothetical protein V493_01013 [Pseudogymnoascus sp. VKM F-4281 (FW-2241)]|nr:hypothetical protein V493_01013 [Pseudogymnoascus sp. VKM F-4281 (FW-2241)]